MYRFKYRRKYLPIFDIAEHLCDVCIQDICTDFFKEEFILFKNIDLGKWFQCEIILNEQEFDIFLYKMYCYYN